MKNRWIAFILLIFVLASCRATHVPGLIEDKKLTLPQQKLSTLSYALLNQSVFIPKCVSCHGTSGKVRLETYPDLVDNKNLIIKAVFQEKTMPKRGSLSNEELSYLWNWLQMGSPQFALNGQIDPPFEPLIATYDSIDKHIFQVACKDCHNPEGSGKRILLDKDSLMSSPLELILPGNPEESGLVIAIERNDGKRMPPSKEGFSALSSEAKAIVRTWIENGATD